MADEFNPYGSDVPGWDINEACPPPETLSAEELFVHTKLLDGPEREYKIKMRKLLAIVAQKLNLPEP